MKKPILYFLFFLTANLLLAQPTITDNKAWKEDLNNAFKSSKKIESRKQVNESTRLAQISFYDMLIDSIRLMRYDDLRYFNIQKHLKEELQKPKSEFYLVLYDHLFDETALDSNTIKSPSQNLSNSDFRMLFKNVLDSSNISLLDVLIGLLELNTTVLDEVRIEFNLSHLNSFHVVQYLYNFYEGLINSSKIKLTDVILQRNLRLISERLARIEKLNFVLYQSTTSKNSIIKSVDFFIDNDVFVPIPKMNQDREYTGGGGLSFSTDYLKWRWINTGWLRDFSFCRAKRIQNFKRPHSSALTYQSLRLGMQFYTPYIRYNDNFALADSLFKLDRPFGSTVFLERGKFRLWPSGLMRNSGQFQVGQIGNNAGRDIQAMLHKDVITESQKVYGWDKQIGNGGIWAAQLNHKLDILIFSNTNDYSSIFAPHRKSRLNIRNKRRYTDELYGQLKKKYLGFNAYNSTEIMVGGFQTAFGTGFYFSGLDFTKQSGSRMIASRRKNRYEFGFNWEVGIKYRYVIHNSMLQGFGYFKTIPEDPNDDEAISVYTLPSKTIQRNLWMGELKLNLRFRKMTGFFNLIIQSKEYKIDDKLDFDAKAAYVNAIPPENLVYYHEHTKVELQHFKDLKYYGYGTLGLSWLIE